MKKQKKKNQVKILSPKNYIRNHVRKLPIYECWVDSQWEKTKMCNIIVSRKHYNGDFTLGIYLVDLGCLGIKNTFYRYKISKDEYHDMLQDLSENEELELIDYVLAHNIIYSALEFAEDIGFLPHKDFDDITKFILEEDDENIEMLDIECGADGKPFYLAGPYDSEAFQNKVINTLLANVGKDKFDFISHNVLDVEDFDDEEYFEDDSDFENINDEPEIFKLVDRLSSFDPDEYELNDATRNWYLEKKDNAIKLNSDEYEKFLLLSMAYINHFSEEKRADEIEKQVIGDFCFEDISDQLPSMLTENLNTELKEAIIRLFSKNKDHETEKLGKEVLKKIKTEYGKVPIYHYIKYSVFLKKNQKHLNNFLNSIDDSNKEQPIVKILTKHHYENSMENTRWELMPIYTLSDFFDKNEKIKLEELISYLALSLKLGTTSKDFSYKQVLIRILIGIIKFHDSNLKISLMLLLFVIANIDAIGQKLSEQKYTNLKVLH